MEALLDVAVDDLPGLVKAGVRSWSSALRRGPVPRLSRTRLIPATARSQLSLPGRGRFLLWRSAGPSSEVEM